METENKGESTLKKIFRHICSAILACGIAAAPLCVRPNRAWAEPAPPEVSAPAAVLMDAGSGTLLYEKNAHEHRPCGSVTKLMSILLFMEALDSGKMKITDEVTVSAFANSMGGSEIWLEVGEKMSVDDLLKAVIIQSANDATVALAEQVAGSEEAFLAAMNRHAEELGMADTHYLNTTGFDEDGQYTSAYDIALIAQELIRHPRVFDYSMIWMADLRGGKTQLANTNKLLKTYSGITGLKTGTTSKAGNCFCGTAERDGLRLISVVLGCATSAERFGATKQLLDFGYANWRSLPIAATDELLHPVPVRNGMQDTVVGTVVRDCDALLAPRGSGEAEYRLTLVDDVEAPVEQGQKLGTVDVVLGGETLHTFPVVSTETVNKITFKSAFLTLFHALICGRI